MEAAGLIAGIGFTVSLFVAELAFPRVTRLETAKVAALTASLAAALLGLGALGLVSRRPLDDFGRDSDRDDDEQS